MPLIPVKAHIKKQNKNSEPFSQEKQKINHWLQNILQRWLYSDKYLLGLWQVSIRQCACFPVRSLTCSSAAWTDRFTAPWQLLCSANGEPGDWKPWESRLQSPQTPTPLAMQALKAYISRVPHQADWSQGSRSWAERRHSLSKNSENEGREVVPNYKKPFPKCQDPLQKRLPKH